MDDTELEAYVSELRTLRKSPQTLQAKLSEENRRAGRGEKATAKKVESVLSNLLAGL